MFKKISLSVLVYLFSFSYLPAGEGFSRSHIWAVGSGTVFPFTTVVAEQFGKIGKYKTPLVESNGTGAGFKMFCGGVGDKFPDIASASRAIKDGERKDCEKNNVKEITEIKIGIDGLAIATNTVSKLSGLTKEQLFLASVRKVPVKGALVSNPYKKWKDIDPNLPDIEIEIYGPAPSHGTRDAFVDLVMKKACTSFKEYKSISKDEKEYEANCSLMREDGKFIEVTDNYNVVVQKLLTNQNAVGVVGFSFLEENSGKIKAITVDKTEPTYENISSGKYVISRPLYIYVKKAHINKAAGLKEFLKEYMDEKTAGDTGSLAMKGLVALPKGEREAIRKLINSL